LIYGCLDGTADIPKATHPNTNDIPPNGINGLKVLTLAS